MELREAIDEIRNKGVPVRYLSNEFASYFPLGSKSIATILNAVADGTLIPADSVFQVKEGYGLVADDPMGLSVPLSEALTIRSADDVRREAYQEGYNEGFKRKGWKVLMEKYPLHTPQPKGGDDE